MKLWIMRGLPASGKSTWAQAWVAEDPEHRVRVNRDALRAMTHDSMFISQTPDRPGTEKIIQVLRDAAISASLKRRCDVVCDDTNLTSRTVRELIKLATLANADHEVVDLTDVPLDECLRRNALREGKARVPDNVIEDMYRRYIKGRVHPLPISEVPMTGRMDLDSIDPYVPNPNTLASKAVIFDVDGTVALMGTRSPFSEELVHQDEPNIPVIMSARARHALGYQIVFCSGRTIGCYDETYKWLEKHVQVPISGLYMRPLNDNRSDVEVKLELFQIIREKFWVECVYDDRKSVVAMWRALGIPTFQVAEGDF